MNSSISLNNGLLAIAGFIAIIAGLAFNGFLFTTYADGLGLPMQGGMAVLGVTLDVIKISLIVIFFTVLIPSGRYGLAFFTAIFAVLLTCLSLFSGFGSQINVLQKSEEAIIEGSQAKILATHNLESARESVESLGFASGLNVNTIQSQIDALLSTKPMNSRGVKVNSTLGSLTSNCSNTRTFYYRYCSDYAGLNGQLTDARMYKSANDLLAERETAVLTVGTAIGTEELGTNAVFVYAAAITGYTAKGIKSFIGSMISLLLEFVGTLSLIVSNFTRRVALGYQYEQPPLLSAQNAQLSDDNQKVIQSLQSEIATLRLGNTAQDERPGVQEDVHAIPLKKKTNVKKFFSLGENESDEQPSYLKKEGDVHPTLLRADNGVSGDNSNRFKAVKRAVKTGQIKPTLQGIMSFKHGDIGCNRNIAKKYQIALAAAGDVEKYTLSNGNQSFRMVTA